MNLFIKVGFVIAERTLLIPSIGYSYLIALGYQKLKETNKLRTLVMEINIKLPFANVNNFVDAVRFMSDNQYLFYEDRTKK